MLKHFLQAFRDSRQKSKDENSRDVVGEWHQRNAARLTERGRDPVPELAAPAIALRNVPEGAERVKQPENANSAKVRERLASLKGGRSKGLRKAS